MVRALRHDASAACRPIGGAQGPGKIAEDWCLAEEKAPNTAPQFPASTDLPWKFITLYVYLYDEVSVMPVGPEG
jgi:hypothetical protein